MTWVAEGWVVGPSGAVKLQVSSAEEPTTGMMERLKRHVDTMYWLTYNQWTGAKVSARKYEQPVQG